MSKKIFSMAIVAVMVIASLSAVAVTTTNTHGDSNAIDDYIRGIKYADQDVVMSTTDKIVPCTGEDDGSNYVVIRYKQQSVSSDGSGVLCNSDSVSTYAYPGALLRANSNLANNTPESVSVPSRTDLTYNITLTGIDGGFTANPGSYSNVKYAIDQKCKEWGTSGSPMAAEMTTSFVKAESYNQVKTSLNLSANALGGLGFSTTWTTEKKQTTYVANYLQTYYTVSVNLLNSPSKYFGSDVTLDDVKSQIFNHNQGVIVNSVVYGRMIAVSLTSSESSDDVDIALQAAIKGTEESLTNEQKKVLSNVTTSIYVYGGKITETPTTVEEVVALMKDTSIDSESITTAVPVNYVTTYIDTNKRAKCMSMSTYNEKLVETLTPITLHYDNDGWYNAHVYVYYNTFDHIDSDGNFVDANGNIITENTTESSMHCIDKDLSKGKQYNSSIPAKHFTTMKIKIHADAGSDVYDNYIIKPYDNVSIYCHGSVVWKAYANIFVDGVQLT